MRYCLVLLSRIYMSATSLPKHELGSGMTGPSSMLVCSPVVCKHESEENTDMEHRYV
jgi:hypothetical protein